MTDRPVPSAWMCVTTHQWWSHVVKCEERFPKIKHTPLYPPSVVAGELRAIEKYYHGMWCPQGTVSRVSVVHEAARRAEKWEKP